MEKIMLVVKSLQSVDEMGFGDIVSSTGLPRSTVGRLLATLLAAELIIQNPSTRRYRLSLRWLTIGTHALEHLAFPQLCQPHLEHLRDRTEMTSHVAVLELRDVVFVAKVEPPGAIRLYTNVGMRAWAPCTASGKVLLAALPDSEVLGRLGPTPWPAFTANTITTPVALGVHLEQVRQQGFAIDDEEHRVGIRCIAAPIQSRAGNAVAAVSVSGLASQIAPAVYPKIIEAVRETAQVLSTQLGLVARLPGTTE